MIKEITDGLEWADQVDIASGFAGKEVLDDIGQAIHQAKKTKRELSVRLLVGLYQRFTSPSTIKKALAIQETFPRHFHVKIARNRRFHWKLYMFGKRATRRLYVGSANFTRDGLTASGELCVRISAGAKDLINLSLVSEFDNMWRKEAFSPDSDFLKRYRKIWRRSERSRGKDSALDDLLRRPERTRFRPSRLKPRLICVDADLGDEAKEKIKQETEWDQRRWTYICFSRRNDRDVAQRAGVILEADRRNKIPVLEFGSVEDVVDIETSDGNYFLAYSAISRGRSVQYKGQAKRLLSLYGLGKSKLKSDRYLEREQLEQCAKLMNVTPWLRKQGLLD